MRSILPILSTVTLLAAAASIARADRTIRFPDQSVGTVSIRPASLGGFGYSLFDEGARKGWTRLGPAAGEVVIPDDHVVRLEVTREGAADLSWVKGLPADAIDALEAGRTPVDDAGAGQLSRLVGLKHLELSGTEITSTAAAALAKLIDLQHLSVHSTAIDDEAMPAIAALPRLETVADPRRNEPSPWAAGSGGRRWIRGSHWPAHNGRRRRPPSAPPRPGVR